MAKTLVAAKHGDESKLNGAGGCHAREGTDGSPYGFCPGVATAKWLNSLGDDAEPFGTFQGVTNGKVRDNYIRQSDHLVAVDPALAKVDQQLRIYRAAIKDLEKRRQQLTACARCNRTHNSDDQRAACSRKEDQ